MLMTQIEAKRLIDKVLSYSKADECGVTVGASTVANNRFANNSITTSGEVRGVAVTVTSTKAKKSGTIASNETSDDALRAAVAKSEELASYAPADPEYVEPVGPQKYPQIDAYDETAARAAQKEMNPGIRAAVAGAAAKGANSYGYYERSAEALAVGNKRGNFGYATRTNVDYSVTVRTPDGTGSGWAAADGVHWADVDAAAVSQTAIDKAILSQKPRRLEPGKYTVVLEAAAVAEMLPPMNGGFNARNVDEGRSFLTKKGGGSLVGEKLFSEKVTVRNDPFDPRNPQLPWQGNVATSLAGVGQFFFGGGGGGGASFLPADKMTWVEKGVVKNVAYNRYWAMKKGVPPSPSPNQGLVIEGEDHSVEDLIKATDRGLLVTRFWYIRFVNPQTVQLTGLTRDGIFMIENGKLAYPVMNFRWNESPLNVLKNVEMLSRSKPIGGAILPAMKVRDFNFTSLSDAV